MQSSSYLYFLLFLLIDSLIVQIVFCAQNVNNVYYCGACKLLIDEIEYGINSVDPKKTIEVGSFRVDPKGNQKLNEIPYARSEVHLHDLVEKACENTKKYALVNDPQTKRQSFVRIEGHDGKEIEIVGEKDTSDLIRSKLRFACETIIEEHEEDMVKLLSKYVSDASVEFCNKQTNHCKLEDLIQYPSETVKEHETDDDIHEL